MDQRLDTLRKKYPWPTAKPDLAFDEHGWFGWCHQAVLDVALPMDAKVIVEMGSWLGKSTRFLLAKAPAAEVVAIDHWLGDSSILQESDDETKRKLATLYEQFLSNCWGFRDRLIPIQATTIEGLEEVRKTGTVPDFIYLDASHQYEDVKADLSAIGKTFPSVKMAGDDYGGKWLGVKKAVDEHAAEYGLIVCSVEHAWTLVVPGARDGMKERLYKAALARFDQMNEDAERIRQAAKETKKGKAGDEA